MLSFKPFLISLFRPMLFTALALLHSAIAPAQNQRELGLIREKLAQSEEDNSRADLLIDLGTYYLIKHGEVKTDMDSAILLRQQALVLSTKLKYNKGIGRCLLLEGQIYHEQGDNKRSWNMLQKTVFYGNAYHLHQQIGEAYRAMSFHFSNNGADLEKRILYNQKAAQYFEKSASKMLLARTLETLGDLYQLKDDYSTAIPLLKRSLSISDSIGDKDTQGVYNLLGYIYIFEQNHFEALKHLLTAVKVAEQQKDSTTMLATIYNRLGSVYLDMLEFDKALAAYKNGLQIAERNKDKDATSEIQLRIITTLRKTKNYRQALVMLNNVVNPKPDKDYRIRVAYEFFNVNMALKRYNNAGKYVDTLQVLTKVFPDYEPSWQSFYLASVRYHFHTRQFKAANLSYYGRDAIKKLKSNLSFLTLYELYWSKIDSAQGNHLSALNHFQIYKALSDSITSSNNSKQLFELQLQYETVKKDQNISILTQKSQLQQTLIHNQKVIRNVIIVGLIVLLIFSGLIYSRYLLNKRVNEKLAIKQTEINGQNKILQKLLEEKEWLLKEIHHRVKNNLQIVISLLNSQSAFLENKDALEAIQKSQHRMHAMSLIHQRLYQSGNMANIDMHWYIHELVTYMKESFCTERKISFALDVDQLDLDVAQAVPLGLILNEAITNAIKYAFPENQKGKVAISFKTDNQDMYLLTIADNGVGLSVGFDLQTIESLGMSLMQGLSEQLDGKLLINSDNGLILSVNFKKNRQLLHV